VQHCKFYCIFNLLIFGLFFYRHATLDATPGVALIRGVFMLTRCPNDQCQHTYKVADQYLGQKVRCKHCEISFVVEEYIPSVEMVELPLEPSAAQSRVSDHPSQVANRKKSVEFAGTGCLVQGLGVLILIAGFFTFGIPGFLICLAICIGLFIVGSRISTFWTCSACGNKIDGEHVLICPTCKAKFE
jgi:hypothetical protein